MGRRTKALACALAVGLAAGPAVAADPAEWAPPDATLTVVVRGFGLYADLLDTVERRFGAEPAVARAVAALRTPAPAGIGLGTRAWGEGLALERGFGLFARAPEAMRLVVGADDAEKAKARLAQVFAALGAEAEATPAGLRLAGTAMNCALRGAYLVCDAGEVPAKAPGRPAAFGAAPVPTDGALLVHAGPGFVEQLGAGVPLQAVWLGVERVDDRVRVSAAATLPPPVAAALAPLRAGEGRAAGLGSVDVRSPGVLKLSFDGAQLLAGAEAHLGGAAPPAVAPLWSALKAGWSGDLVVSLAGGLGHPVLALGLTKPEAVADIVAGLVRALQAGGVFVRSQPAGADGAGTLLVEVSLSPTETVVLRLRHGVCGDALVFALSPSDVSRCALPGARVAPLPDGFAAKGAHGVVLWDVLGFLTSGVPQDLVELHAPGLSPLVAPAFTLASVYAYLVDELGAAVRVNDEGLAAEIWWRLL